MTLRHCKLFACVFALSATLLCTGVPQAADTTAPTAPAAQQSKPATAKQTKTPADKKAKAPAAKQAKVPADKKAKTSAAKQAKDPAIKDPATKAPATKASATKAPATKAPATKASPTKQNKKPAAKAPATQIPAETQEGVQVKLDIFAKSHVVRANQTLRPNRQFVEVRREGAEYAAWFSEVDTESVRTELYPSNTPGCQYVGHVIYVEKVYASLGKDKIEATKGEYKQVRLRRVRELTRYDKGQWRY